MIRYIYRHQVYEHTFYDFPNKWNNYRFRIEYGFPQLQDYPFQFLLPLFCNFFLERIGRLKCRNVMSRNNQGGVLADVTRGLLCSLLDDKATKASEIYVFTMCETVLHNGHELFDNGNNCGLVDAGCLCDFTRYFCLSHFVLL